MADRRRNDDHYPELGDDAFVGLGVGEENSGVDNIDPSGEREELTAVVPREMVNRERGKSTRFGGVPETPEMYQEAAAAAVSGLAEEVIAGRGEQPDGVPLPVETQREERKSKRAGLFSLISEMRIPQSVRRIGSATLLAAGTGVLFLALQYISGGNNSQHRGSQYRSGSPTTTVSAPPYTPTAEPLKPLEPYHAPSLSLTESYEGTAPSFHMGAVTAVTTPAEVTGDTLDTHAPALEEKVGEPSVLGNTEVQGIEGYQPGVLSPSPEQAGANTLAPADPALQGTLDPFAGPGESNLEDHNTEQKPAAPAYAPSTQTVPSPQGRVTEAPTEFAALEKAVGLAGLERARRRVGKIFDAYLQEKTRNGELILPCASSETGSCHTLYQACRGLVEAPTFLASKGITSDRYERVVHQCATIGAAYFGVPEELPVGKAVRIFLPKETGRK